MKPKTCPTYLNFDAHVSHHVNKGPPKGTSRRSASIINLLKANVGEGETVTPTTSNRPKPH